MYFSKIQTVWFSCAPNVLDARNRYGLNTRIKYIWTWDFGWADGLGRESRLIVDAIKVLYNFLFILMRGCCWRNSIDSFDAHEAQHEITSEQLCYLYHVRRVNTVPNLYIHLKIEFQFVAKAESVHSIRVNGNVWSGMPNVVMYADFKHIENVIHLLLLSLLSGASRKIITAFERH